MEIEEQNKIRIMKKKEAKQTYEYASMHVVRTSHIFGPRNLPTVLNLYLKNCKTE